MKKGAVVLVLLGVLLVLPLIQAQDQSQTYSGFERTIDGVKLFFSFGDSKVTTALEIREKEVNSAIENALNGDEAGSDKNLEKAWNKLQIIQEKVTLNTAGEVKNSSNEIRNRIMQEENLSENFDVYVLEEEKTGLTAEWVVEVNGKEGQTLSNEFSSNGTEGQTLKREIVGNATGGQNRTVVIENRIDEIDGEISNWVVEHTYAEGTTADGESGVVYEGGLARVVKTEVAQGDNGLKPEVKTSVAGDGTLRNDPLPEPDLNQINPDLYDPDARAPGDTVDETYDDEFVNQGSCGDGVVCEGDNNVIEGGQGTPGTNDIAPAVESNDGAL